MRQYYPIPSDEEGVLLLDRSPSDLHQPSESHALYTGRHVKWIRYTTAACVLCTVVNIILLAYIPASPMGISTYGMQNKGLRRPSHYIGLETVDRTQYPFTPEPLVNFAPLLTQVSKESADFVYPDEPHRWLSWEGTMSPDDRHFLISSETKVATVAQFRVHDYGMEDCQIVVNIPYSDALAASPGNKTFTLNPAVAAVEVWKIHTNDVLNPHRLSWRTLPSRRELMDTVPVQEGFSAATGHFPCSRDSLQTFLFMCKNGESCEVDFWQDKRGSLLAAYLLQHPSL